MIAIVDYGMGNLKSVFNAFKKVAPNLNIVITSNPDIINSADRIVFPGQGAMPDCLRELEKKNLTQVITHASKNKPFLGICIGMQMLNNFSEEGLIDCLGVIPGSVKKFKPNNHYSKVPHMGWNQVRRNKDHFLWNGITNNERFYFVHSYYVHTADEIKITGTTSYGTEIISCLAEDNIFATQFHPEKSQKVGLTLLRNFLKWDGNA